MVHFTERSRSFSHFLTSVCAIVGGVVLFLSLSLTLTHSHSLSLMRVAQFTVASLVDGFIHFTSLKLKTALGKAS